LDFPCHFVAPPDCLQYFTAGAGQVKSFNWQDSDAARQLNNQNYNICFRTELVAGAVRGFDPATGAFFDRYCGSELNTASVCSMFDLFTLVISLFSLIMS
jgi:hypothetical protein